MNVFISNQNEILNESGYQKWHKVIVRDFGDSNIEVSVMPHETWSEPCEEDLLPRVKRGEGDRERSREVSARRAKRNVRHKCKLLKARYMVTLSTKENITDVDRFQRLFQEFVRRVRRSADFEYVATHETQERGALHLHIAVANKQDYKFLWSVWLGVVGIGQGRVHVTSGSKASSVNRIAGYISKYIAKSFETGELNKRRYWASKGIAKAIKTVHLLRSDWSYTQVILFVRELCDEMGCTGFFNQAWCNSKKGLLWIAIDSHPIPLPIQWV
jgi:hypothetical protein